MVKVNRKYHIRRKGVGICRIRKNPIKKIILYRNKREEEPYVHMWYATKNMDFMVSLVGKPGDIRTRITTPKGCRELGHPFAEPSTLKQSDYERQRYKEGIARIIKSEFGYNVELRG